MEIGLFKRNSEKVEGGDWIDKDDLPILEDIRLKVRGSGSKIARKAYTAAVQSKGNGKESTHDDILATLRHEVILLDWEGFTHNGNPIPYSQELARYWCTHPDFYEFQQLVDSASNFVNLRRSEVEIQLGELSPAPSSGNSDGDSTAPAL